MQPQHTTDDQNGNSKPNGSAIPPPPPPTVTSGGVLLIDLPQLGNQFPRGDSVAGDSIEELGDSEPKNYNEDGSFIGEYGHISSSTATTPPTDDAETPQSPSVRLVPG